MIQAGLPAEVRGEVVDTTPRTPASGQDLVVLLRSEDIGVPQEPHLGVPLTEGADISLPADPRTGL